MRIHHIDVQNEDRISNLELEKGTPPEDIQAWRLDCFETGDTLMSAYQNLEELIEQFSWEGRLRTPPRETQPEEMDDVYYNPDPFDLITPLDQPLSHMALNEPSEEVNGIWDSDDEDVYVDDGILPTYHTIAEGDEDFSHIPLGSASPLYDVNGSVLPLKDTTDNTFGPALPPKAANESSPPKDSNVQVLTRAGRLNPPQNATQT